MSGYLGKRLDPTTYTCVNCQAQGNYKVNSPTLCVTGEITRALRKELDTWSSLVNVGCDKYYNCVSGNPATLGLY